MFLPTQLNRGNFRLHQVNGSLGMVEKGLQAGALVSWCCHPLSGVPDPPRTGRSKATELSKVQDPPALGPALVLGCQWFFNLADFWFKK